MSYKENIIFFAKKGKESSANPMKIEIDGYEISISGDDSCGALDQHRRTELLIFDSKEEVVFRTTMVSVQSILDAIQWIKNQDRRVITIDDAKRIAKEWNPQFKTVSSIQDAAEAINLPHEDYPDRVDRTRECINSLAGFKNEIMRDGLMLRDCMSIHSFIMDDIKEKGDVRITNVKVGTHIAPEAYLVREMLEQIFPFKPKNKEEIVEWYSLFQTIHPFADGNGRVGGTIVAFWSYMLDGKFLAPKQ